MGLIRRPTKISRRVVAVDDGQCLARQMGLVNSPADVTLYFEILGTVGTYCDRYMPPHKDMEDVRDAKHMLYDKVKKKHPVLERYEELWPIGVMLNQHRQLRRAGASRGIIRTEDEIKACKRHFVKQHVRGEEGKKKSPVRSSTRPAEVHSINSMCYKSTQKENVPLPSSSTSQQSRARSTATLVVEQPPTNAVILFLQSLAQDLSFLLSTFVSHGVKDGPSLCSVLGIANWRAWLYSWVKEGMLTELQFKMVCDGFERMAAELL
ncbi:hypothetical protein C8Q76DRAFT_742385 [Earliella scabrosa]|nr:hypothetical protein C8Q76DRAFT_742385 [Earliella scabrosa]